LKPSVLIPLVFLLASCRREEIDTPIVADFAYEVVDNDYSIPSKSPHQQKHRLTNLYCTFEGGSPETYTQKDPGYIIFSKPSPTRHQINIICFIQ